MPKSKPILVGVLHRLTKKSEFIEHVDSYLKEYICIIQERYLTVDFNVNLLSENKMLLKKNIDSYSHTSPLVKKIFRSLLFPLPPSFMEPTRPKEHSKTLIDHILTNSPEKVIQIGVIKMELSAHELIY